MDTPRKVGRPRLEPDEKRTVRLAIKLSPAEKVALASHAKAQKMTLARSVRSAALAVVDSTRS